VCGREFINAENAGDILSEDVRKELKEAADLANKAG